MHTPTIEELLREFHITEEDIRAREQLEEKLPTLSTILIDKFYLEYLKENREIAHYFQQIDADHLLRRIKEFLIFIFSAPLDEAYLKTMQKVGHLHASIGLDAAKVKYAFWGIGQLLNRMSVVDPTVHSNLGLISKFLAMAEHVIIETAYTCVHSSSDRDMQTSSILMFSDLYSAFSIHRESCAKIEKILQSSNKTADTILSILDNPQECKFNQILGKLEDQPELLRASGIDLLELKELNLKWHEAMSRLKQSIKTKDREKAVADFDTLMTLTDRLHALMEKPLEEFSSNSFLSLSAGLKAIHTVNELFTKRDLIFFTQGDIQENIIDEVIGSVRKVLGWAIEAIDTDTDYLDVARYDLTKRIQFKGHTFYLGIRIKPLTSKLYLKEILTLLLEALELNFSIKEREQSLLVLADKTESANRSKDAFLASMSHEIRTPLTAIIGFSDILMIRPDTPEATKETLKKINIAGNNLLEIVNTILDFAKLEAGKMKFEPKISSVYLILREVETLTLPMAQQKNISLDIVVDLHLYLMVDPVLLKQAIVNLVSNAIKFTPRGGRVWLALDFDEKYKTYRFSLCDNGIGISKEDQARLFDSFVQLDNVYQKSTSGSGLGLMICKKIVEDLHRGRIWVESEPGKGSCFHITIPTVEMTTNTYTVFEAPETARHILIVEDSKMYRELFEDQLKEKFRLTFTDSNNGAKKLLAEEKFDMVILDFYLTDGIGLEVLRYMEEERIDTPAIIITVESESTVTTALHNIGNVESILSKKEVKQLCDRLKSDS